MSNIKKLMQVPCSEFVSFLNVFLLLLLLSFSLCFLVFTYLLFLSSFSLALFWVLISRLKPNEAYSKYACTVRKFEANLEAIAEKKGLDFP